VNEIEQAIQKCSKCKGLTKLKYETISYGTNRDLLFIGESPAKSGWLTTGRAFYNKEGKLLPTGRVLNRLLAVMNLSVDDITFTEACKCYLPDRNLLKNAASNCLVFLEKQIDELDSKILITLGEHTTRLLLPNVPFKCFKEVVGRMFKIEIMGKERIIIPIYHPSPVNPKSYKFDLLIFEKIKKIYDGLLNEKQLTR
jgi:uracil-DNA glycosylase family 4